MPVGCLLAAVTVHVFSCFWRCLGVCFGPKAMQLVGVACGTLGLVQARKVVGLAAAWFWTSAAGLCLFCLVVCGAPVDSLRLCVKEQVKLLLWILFPTCTTTKFWSAGCWRAYLRGWVDGAGPSSPCLPACLPARGLSQSVVSVWGGVDSSGAGLQRPGRVCVRLQPLPGVAAPGATSTSSRQRQA